MAHIGGRGDRQPRLGVHLVVPFFKLDRNLLVGRFVGTACRLLFVALALLAATATAEQFKPFGEWQVHYVAFNAMRLPAAVAERYGIVRGPTKGLLNVTAMRQGGTGKTVQVSGRFLNLLGQPQALSFRQIEDDGAVYYLAAFDFENAEVLRFEIALELPGYGPAELRFQQPLHVPYP